MPSLPTALPILDPGTVLPVATYNIGPFVLGDANGFVLDMTRSDDGTNGTCTVALMVEDPALDAPTNLFTQLDGAGNGVDINDWAAGENVRRTLSVHPTAGPMPTDDPDGVFAVGTTGVASDYFRQPVLEPFWFRIVVATDASTFSRATLYFVR